MWIRLVFLPSRSCVGAVDTNIKCSVHLKSLSLPNMGKTKSLSLDCKCCQNDCKCVKAAGILLLWPEPFQPFTCQPGYVRVRGPVRVFVSRASVPHLRLFSSM